MTASEIKWLEAHENPWGVRVLDIRPITQNVLLTSSDPRCAINAVSFLQDDGTGFIGEEPRVARVVKANLIFPTDRKLADGVLFTPSTMEHKWALFYHRRKIICVRSWLRQVAAVALVEEQNDHIAIKAIRGTIAEEVDDPEYSVRAFNFLLRSHALGAAYPAPLPPGLEQKPQDAARWCLSTFGKLALFATPYQIKSGPPEKPLRTHSLLHIGIARGDVAMVEASLAAGIPVDQLAGDGLAPLHWALSQKDSAIMALLLKSGSPVDVRSSEGATPLITAVQNASMLDKALFLLDHGADVNARDLRGFDSLQCAAYAGHVDLVKMLLSRGASPHHVLDGQTAKSFAEMQGHSEIVAILSAYDSGV